LLASSTGRALPNPSSAGNEGVLVPDVAGGVDVPAESAGAFDSTPHATSAAVSANPIHVLMRVMAVNFGATGEGWSVSKSDVSLARNRCARNTPSSLYSLGACVTNTVTESGF
jgi:hypothetical protein